MDLHARCICLCKINYLITGRFYDVMSKKNNNLLDLIVMIYSLVNMLWNTVTGVLPQVSQTNPAQICEYHYIITFTMMIIITIIIMVIIHNNMYACWAIWQDV